MKNILILGAISPFCDLIEDIKNKGYQTIACDYYKDAAAKKAADISYDASTMDIEAVEAIAKKHSVSAIVSAFSDRNLLPAYTLCQRLGLKTLYDEKIIDAITNKDKMKEDFKTWGFPVIPYKIIKREFKEEELAEFVFPVIVKPIDSYGSKGIFICDTVEEIRDRFESVVKEALEHKDEILVEEYYPVDEISISAWVSKGKSYITCIYDVGKNFGKDVSLSSVIFPSKYTHAHLEEFERLTQELVDHYEIEEGPVTVQCFIGERGLKVSEFLYRLAGGSPYIYPTLYGGPNTAQMLVDTLMGEEADIECCERFQADIPDSFYDFKITAMKAGTVKFDFTEKDICNTVDSCVKVIFYRQNGEKIVNVPKNGEPVVRVFCKVKDRKKETYESLLYKLSECVRIYDESGEDITGYNFPTNPVNNDCYDFTLQM